MITPSHVAVLAVHAKSQKFKVCIEVDTPQEKGKWNETFQVLESFKIMDYSLLVSMHNVDQAETEKVSLTGGVVENPGT